MKDFDTMSAEYAGMMWDAQTPTLATVRDIHDIREIFIAATGSAYINAGHVFDTIIEEHTARHIDEAYEKGYDDRYYDGHYALREVENGVH